jgi:putative transposase
MFTEFKELSKKFWDRHIGAAGYFATSSGNVTDEVIMQYLESQDVEQKDDDFRITE